MFQKLKWSLCGEADIIESISKYLNLELEFVKNDIEKKNGKREIIELLTKNVWINLFKLILIKIIFNQKADYFNDYAYIDNDNYHSAKFSAIINDIYQINFGQRKFTKENAFDEFAKFYEKEVWFMIFVSLLILTFVLSIKYWIRLKRDFCSSLSSFLINLIGHLLLNNPGDLI